MADRPYHKKLEVAWRVLFVAALVDLLLGLGVLLVQPSIVLLMQELGLTESTGLTPVELQALNPGLYAWLESAFKSWSGFVIGSSVLTMGIAAKPYREGERWAWITLVIAHLPACLIFLSIAVLLGSEFLPFIGLMVSAYLISLLLPAGEFLRGERQ